MGIIFPQSEFYPFSFHAEGLETTGFFATPERKCQFLMKLIAHRLMNYYALRPSHSASNPGDFISLPCLIFPIKIVSISLFSNKKDYLILIVFFFSFIPTIIEVNKYPEVWPLLLNWLDCNIP